MKGSREVGSSSTEVQHRLRRVGHSYAVTLPSQWMNVSGWKRDDVLRLRKVGPAMIMVDGPSEHLPPETVNITADGDGTHLFRELLGAYLQGHETISLSGPRIPSCMPQAVREFQRKTATMVIVEEDSSHLTLQDVSGSGAPLLSRMIRMHSLVLGMHETVSQRWTEDPYTAIDDLSTVDDEVDRVFWQVRRSLVRRKGGSSGIPAEEAIPVILLSLTWEQIGDLAVRMAEEQVTLSGNTPSRSILTDIAHLHERTIEMLRRAPGVLSAADLKEANEFIDNVSAWEGEPTAVMVQAVHLAKEKKLSSEALASVSIVLASLVRMARHLADVGEIVLDSPLGTFSDQGHGNMSEKNGGKGQ